MRAATLMTTYVIKSRHLSRREPTLVLPDLPPQLVRKERQDDVARWEATTGGTMAVLVLN
jgi:hypothetical protein